MIDLGVARSKLWVDREVKPLNFAGGVQEYLGEMSELMGRSVVGFMVLLGALYFDMSVSCSLIKQARRHYIIPTAFLTETKPFSMLGIFPDGPLWPAHFSNLQSSVIGEEKRRGGENPSAQVVSLPFPGKTNDSH